MALAISLTACGGVKLSVDGVPKTDPTVSTKNFLDVTKLEYIQEGGIPPAITCMPNTGVTVSLDHLHQSFSTVAFRADGTSRFEAAIVQHGAVEYKALIANLMLLRKDIANGYPMDWGTTSLTINRFNGSIQTLPINFGMSGEEILMNGESLQIQLVSYFGNKDCVYSH